MSHRMSFFNWFPWVLIDRKKDNYHPAHSNVHIYAFFPAIEKEEEILFTFLSVIYSGVIYVLLNIQVEEY